MREREMRVSQRDLPRLYLVRYQELKDGISSSRSTTIYGSRLARWAGLYCRRTSRTSASSRPNREQVLLFDVRRFL